MSSALLNQEAPFEVHELFFSTTDLRGRITSFNPTFCRIAEHAPADLDKKPHSIIRHPDMPRAAFGLLWSTIQAGKPIGAYVKNKSKTGKYYWVYALVMPVKDGYLSLRLKPTSPILKTVEGLYIEMLKLEDRDFTKSTELLVKTLKSIGYDSYEAFMSDALAAELGSRFAALKDRKTTKRKAASQREGEYSVTLLERVKSEIVEIQKISAEVAKSFDVLKYLSFNMIINAEKSSEASRGLGEIALGFQKMSTEIKEKVEPFVEASQASLGLVRNSQFLIGALSLQIEMINYFQNEGEPSLDDLKLLHSLMNQYMKLVEDNFRTFVRDLRSFLTATEDLGNLMSTLEMIRVSAKVEAAVTGDKMEGFVEQVMLMEKFLKGTWQHLRVMRDTLPKAITFAGEVQGKIDRISLLVNSEIEFPWLKEAKEMSKAA